MQAAVFLGSCNPNGQTAEAVQALIAGLEEAGAQIEEHILSDYTLELCRQCGDDGWGRCHRRQSCILEDDFSGLVDSIREVDLVVFATPVYFADLSESMLAFLGRLRRIQHRKGIGEIVNIPAVGICVAGGGGAGAPESAYRLERILKKIGFDVLDMIPCRRQNLKLKVEVLNVTGRWLGQNLYQFRDF